MRAGTGRLTSRASGDYLFREALELAERILPGPEDERVEAEVAGEVVSVSTQWSGGAPPFSAS